jgi:Ca2+/Na+ antiporter
MFVITIVVGAVVMVADVSVHPRAFARDIGSYIVVLLLILVVASMGTVSVYTSSLFIVLYLAYVGAVMIMDKLARAKKKKRGRPVQGHESAFWMVESDAMQARNEWRRATGEPHHVHTSSLAYELALRCRHAPSSCSIYTSALSLACLY